MLKIGDKIISLEFDKVSMKYRVERINIAKIEIDASGISYYKNDTEYIGGISITPRYNSDGTLKIHEVKEGN